MTELSPGKRLAETANCRQRLNFGESSSSLEIIIFPDGALQRKFQLLLNCGIAMYGAMDLYIDADKNNSKEREKAEAERQRKEEELLATWFFREEYLNAGWFKRLLLTIEFLIRDKHGEGHIPQIPDKIRMEIARCLLPDIIAFFESEKGQKEFEEWRKKNRTTISTKQKNNTHTH